jgi:hypothetical protein
MGSVQQDRVVQPWPGATEGHRAVPRRRSLSVPAQQRATPYPAGTIGLSGSWERPGWRAERCSDFVVGFANSAVEIQSSMNELSVEKAHDLSKQPTQRFLAAIQQRFPN